MLGRIIRSMAIGLPLLGLFTACNERAPRSFVQPNVLKKSDLEGTWYYSPTVVDAPQTSNPFYIGLYGGLQKVRFDIQENYLYARRSYEQVVGSEGNGNVKDDPNYKGVVLAAWKISKQFDIIRDYNPTTGEETNKIIESEERPWNNREFMRVDWSMNSVQNYEGLDLWVLLANSVDVSSTSYWESDPTKPDALHFERADEKDTDFTPNEAIFFDITNRSVVGPPKIFACNSDGQDCASYPFCEGFFGIYNTSTDCAYQNIKIRHAFSKISPKHDYEVREWDGKQQEKFGFFDNRRFSYNRQYGVTNSGFIRRAQRFNLWKKSYRTDGEGNPELIPYEERELRTIPYYAVSTLDTANLLDGDKNAIHTYPTELFDQGREVIRQWDETFKVAVKDLTGTDAPHSVFVWCHNPVKLRDNDGAQCDPNEPGYSADACKDDAACTDGIKPQLDATGAVIKDRAGDPIYYVRHGDYRRSAIVWIGQPQDQGPLGLGPPMSDPETGETLAGISNIYGGGIDVASASGRDIVLAAVGKYTPTTISQGTNVRNYVLSNMFGQNANANNIQGVDANLQTTADIAKRTAAMSTGWAKGIAPEAKLDRTSPFNFISSMRSRLDAIDRIGVLGRTGGDDFVARLSKLKGTEYESQMILPDMMADAGISPGRSFSSLTDFEKAQVSPVRSKAFQDALADRLNQARAMGYDFAAEFYDELVVQRALAFAADPATKNFDPEVIRKAMRKDLFLAVTLHEVGHNMGLRHNFRGSYDAMNYFPKYWELRAAGTSDTQRFTGYNSNGTARTVPYAGTDCAANAGKVRPRYIDCPGGATSASEARGGIKQYQYSSIMDYQADFANGDIKGLGLYDKAAIKFGYANQVEVFTDAKTDQTSILKFLYMQLYSTFYGMPSPIYGTDTESGSVNYTAFPTLFKSGVAGINKREDVSFLDVASVPGDTNNNTAVDSKGRIVVPYYFCSDEFVGDLTCQRYDAGPDAFEQAQDLISRYENFYIFNNFKRDRASFFITSHQARLEGRYFSMLRAQMTWFALWKAVLGTDPSFGDAFFNGENGWGNFTAAVSNGFDMFGRIISKPEPGYFELVTPAGIEYRYPHYRVVRDLSENPNDAAPPGTVKVGLMDGKYATYTWNFSRCGYYWASECFERVGYYLDKVTALQSLADSRADIIGRDTFSDGRRYSLSYYSIFRNQLEEKIGAILAGDYASLAPRIDVTNPNATVITQKSWTLNTAPTDGPTATNIIDPAATFTTQFYASIFALAGFVQTFEHSFIEQARVFVVGNGEAPISDANLVANGTEDPAQLVSTGGNKEWFIYSDKDTGKQYAAHSIAAVPNGDGSPGTYRRDVAARMLTTLGALQTDRTTKCAGMGAGSVDCSNATVAHTQFRQNVDLLRNFVYIFGYGQYR